MSSLTQVSIKARKTIRIGILLITFLLFARVFWNSSVKIYRKIFPAPTAAPTVSFGKLPKIVFPPKSYPSGLTFTLETTEGGYPTLPSQAKVFFMPKPVANLLSLSAAKKKAEGLGFNPDGEKITDSLYRFPHKVAASSLEMDIVSQIFSISYDFAKDSSPLSFRPPFPEVAASQVRSYLSSEDLLPADLTLTGAPEFLKMKDGKFETAISQSEANLVKVKLLRKNYDNLPVLGPDPNDANVWFLVGGSDEKEKKIVVGQFHYFAVDETQFSTYPLITAEEAWNEFAKNGAYVANYGANKENSNVKIRKIYLAYFDPGEVSDFMQPIIVLEGDKGFFAYIQAVRSDYLGE